MIGDVMSTDINVNIDKNPPVKYKAARNSKPSCTKYVFSPKAFYKIKDNVLKVEWNIALNSIKLIVKENAKFEVYKWIMYTIQQNHEREKSPFVDIDNNSATLVFLDENGVSVSTIKFLNLTLKEHKCQLSKIWSDSNYDVIHELEFIYNDHETIIDAENCEEIENVQPSDLECKVLETPP